MWPGSDSPGPSSAHTGYSRWRIARPVIGDILIDGVQPSALSGGAVQLLHEYRRPAGSAARGS